MATKSPSDISSPSHDGALPPASIAQPRAMVTSNTSSGHSQVRHSEEWEEHHQVGEGQAGSSTSATPHSPLEYSEPHDQIRVSQDGLDTQAKVTDDGRLNININEKGRRLSELLVPALGSRLSLAADQAEGPPPSDYIPPALGGRPGQDPPPQLNVVIHVVGSRGDVQPFVALGKTLKSAYGHRVRLATHPTFQSFVEENGLEFFSIGGDPAELMAFMVKNPGLMPGLDSLKSGDVGKRRKGMEELLVGCWRSCIEAGNGLGTSSHKNSLQDGTVFEEGINMDTNLSERTFIADAIIANPPSFAHIHIAEKLGVPLHMMFTMPWSPTQSFPHPLANIQHSNADVNVTNFISYALVEMMTWQGLGDVINRFRQRSLGLDPISLIRAPGMLSRLRIPYTYCWSPALIPKPKDWGPSIFISGFYFLSLASTFTPEPELAAFLTEGPPPIYIGFGSIVVDDPNSMTEMIFEAVKKSGVRALISKGWGGLGADGVSIPEGVFILGNVPHDWLFQHVSCVVHHGGAGTTAAGIALGKPTVVIPFFGDQPFWGAMIAKAGAGPVPIPFKQLTADKLSQAILEALKPSTLEKARELGVRISKEDGTEAGGKRFHEHLDVDGLRCSLAPGRVAVWRVKRTKTRLSALAATVLANEGLLDFGDLKLYRPREYQTDDGPWDPISGGASALLGTLASLAMGVADFPVEIFKSFKAKSTREGSGSAVLSPSDLSSEAPSHQTLDPWNWDDPFATELASSTLSEVSPLDDDDKSVDTLSNASPVTSTIQPTRGASMKQALCQNKSRSRSRSREGHSSRSSSPAGGRTESQSFALTLDAALGASKGISRIVGAGLKSPIDFTLGLARGFRNAPKLYGDDTVRPQEKVTDFKSGLKAAGKEFGYGFYDGVSGLITQPLRGAEKEGAAGLIKGFGKGIGGLVLKPGAAIWGLPGYTMMGIHKEVCKLSGSDVLAYICSMRTAQGYEQWGSSTQEERLDIINQWHKRKSELQSIRQKILEEGPDGQETGRLSPKGILQTRHLSFEERKRLQEARRIRREQEKSKTYRDHGSRYSCQKTPPHRDHVRLPQEGIVADPADQSGSDSGTEDDEDFQLAIKLSKASHEESELRNKMEEDILIEYIQKRSLAEDEYRKSMQDRQKDISSNAVADGDLESATGGT